MKIGFVSDSIEKESAGIGNYSFNLLKEFSKTDNEIYLIDWQEKKYLSKLCKKQIIIPNRWPFNAFKTFSWHLSLLKKISNLNIDFDILFNPSFFPNFMGKSKNFCYVVYDMTPYKLPKEAKTGKNTLFKLFMPKTLKNTNKIITISNHTKNDLIDLMKIDPNKIFVTHLAANNNYKQIKDLAVLKNVRNKYNLPDKFLFCVGTLEPRKNISRLIEAFSNAYDKINIPLVITGKRGWKYDKIFKTISENNLLDKVIFTGYVEENDLPALYNLATIFVYPSLYEGFGLPILEALQCGCRVITSNVSSIPEVGGNAVTYIDPYDVDDLTNAIVKLSSEKQTPDIIEKGLIQSQKFSWKKCAEQTLKIFEGMLLRTVSTTDRK